MIQQGKPKSGVRTVVGAALAIALGSLVACGAPARSMGPGPTFDSGAPRASATGAGNPLGARPSIPAPGPVTTPASTGIVVQGFVFSSPSCPGPAVAESPCPDRPVAGARVELARDSTVVATTSTDSAGRFEMRVPPADYQITAFNVGFASHASQSITVVGPVTVRLVVDSGVR
jgi:hypothetical protein